MSDRKARLDKQTEVVAVLQKRVLDECRRVDGKAASDIKNVAVSLGIAMDKAHALEFPQAR